MANRELALATADAIEQQSIKGLKFNMGSYGSHISENDHLCGITACIAGWVLVVAGKYTPQELLHTVGDDIFDQAKEALDLKHHEAYDLFMENLSASDRDAIHALRHLAITGEVIIPGGHDD